MTSYPVSIRRTVASLRQPDGPAIHWRWENCRLFDDSNHQLGTFVAIPCLVPSSFLLRLRFFFAPAGVCVVVCVTAWQQDVEPDLLIGLARSRLLPADAAGSPPLPSFSISQHMVKLSSRAHPLPHQRTHTHKHIHSPFKPRTFFFLSTAAGAAELVNRALVIVQVNKGQQEWTG